MGKMGRKDKDKTDRGPASGNRRGWTRRLRPPFRSALLNLLAIIVPIVVLILVTFSFVVEKISYGRHLEDLNDRQVRTSYSQVILLAEPVKQGRLEDVQLLLATIIGDPFFVGAKVEDAAGNTVLALGEDVEKGDANLRYTQNILYADIDVPETVGRLTTLVTTRPILSGMADERRQLAVLAGVMLLTIIAAVSKKMGRSAVSAHNE